jgi:hypothetical protein
VGGRGRWGERGARWRWGERGPATQRDGARSGRRRERPARRHRQGARVQYMWSPTYMSLSTAVSSSNLCKCCSAHRHANARARTRAHVRHARARERTCARAEFKFSTTQQSQAASGVEAGGIGQRITARELGAGGSQPAHSGHPLQPAHGYRASPAERVAVAPTPLKPSAPPHTRARLPAAPVRRRVPPLSTRPRPRPCPRARTPASSPPERSCRP